MENTWKTLWFVSSWLSIERQQSTHHSRSDKLISKRHLQLAKASGNALLTLRVSSALMLPLIQLRPVILCASTRFATLRIPLYAHQTTFKRPEVTNTWESVWFVSSWLNIERHQATPHSRSDKLIGKLVRATSAACQGVRYHIADPSCFFSVKSITNSEFIQWRSLNQASWRSLHRTSDTLTHTNTLPLQSTQQFQSSQWAKPKRKRITRD